MKLKVTIANNKAMRLYLAGLSLRHRLFAPLTEQEAKALAKYVKAGDFSLPNYEYSKFKRMKSKVLSSRPPKELSRYISSVKLIGISKNRAEDLKLGLSKSFNSYIQEITSFLSENKLKARNLYNVAIMPLMGESAESLEDWLLIGDGFSKKVAIPVILEEMLHSMVTTARAKKTIPFKVKGVDLEEVAVGFFLHRLLEALKYDKAISDSIVFGWQRGRRSTYVKKAIDHYYRRR